MNGERLSEEGVLSPLTALQTGDLIDFGVDIKDEEGKSLYTKVSTKIAIRYETVEDTGTITRNYNSATINPVANNGRISDADELLAMIQVFDHKIG